MIGAKILGPRIGKYDKNGKPQAILGHNLTFAALGVFILWFCQVSIKEYPSRCFYQGITVHTYRRSSVKSKPAEPEDKDAKRCKCKVMP